MALMALGMLSFWTFDCTLLKKLFQAFLAGWSFFPSLRRDINPNKELLVGKKGLEQGCLKQVGELELRNCSYGEGSFDAQHFM